MNLPLEALERIQQAVADEETIWCLETLGVKHRICQILDTNGFTLLADILAVKKDRLLTIQSFAQKSLDEVLEALARFHELDDIRETDADTISFRSAQAVQISSMS